jgi:cytochrome c oxidase subunit 2
LLGFDPITAQGHRIVDLFWLLLALSLLLFIGICALLTYMVVRFRAHPGAAEPPQRAGNRRLEIAWTAIPVALLAVLFGLTVGTVRAVERPSPSPLRVTVVGHQWWWEFRYSGLNVTTANELHVPVGTPVEITIRSDDVLHSFWIPEFGWMRDAVPNRTNVMQASVDRPGTFEGACTQFCGVQHAWMRSRVVAQPQSEFDAWVRAQQAPETPPTGATDSLVVHGRQLFLSSTCVNCHTVQGTAAAGTAAPNLTHLASRATIGAGVAPNTPEDLGRWVRDPKSVKPGALMPGYPFSDADLSAIVAYLGSLK